MDTKHQIKPLVDECRYETNVDNQIGLLFAINEKLSASEKLELQSLMTDDYVHRALDIIEERLAVTKSNRSLGIDKWCHRMSKNEAAKTVNDQCIVY